MTDRVRMTSQSVFANSRVTVFNAANPEGAKGEPATVGDQIETDLAHAQDLDRLGLAVPLNRADLEGEAQLEPGYQISVTQLRAQEGDSSGDASLRNDGPTVETFVARGYKASNYPPIGYASRSTPEEIAAAIAAETAPPKSDGLDTLTVAELRERAIRDEVDLGDAKKRDDVLAALRAGLAAKAEAA